MFARFFLRMALGLTVGLACGTGVSVAHDWYPLECCTGRDCMRVDNVDRLPDGTMRMQIGRIEVLVPKGFTQRPSLDNDTHVCLRKNGDGTYAPRCVFVPAGA
jgi:hypothetical protein